VLEDGQSAGDVMPEQMRAAVSELAATRADRAIPMPWELWRANFIQTASEHLAPESHRRLVPDPYRPGFEPIPLLRPVHPPLPARPPSPPHPATTPAPPVSGTRGWPPGSTASPLPRSPAPPRCRSPPRTGSPTPCTASPRRPAEP